MRNLSLKALEKAKQLFQIFDQEDAKSGGTD